MPTPTDVSKEMENFAKAVRRLMEHYGIDIAVIGTAMFSEPKSEGFTSFSTLIRDRDVPLPDTMVMLDAIRNDIDKVYDQTATDLIHEARKSVDPKAVQMAIDALTNLAPENETSLRVLGELAGDLVSAKKNEFLH